MQTQQIEPQWLTNHKQSIYDHYLTMCKCKGTKEHAWHMVKELDKTEMHKGIRARIESEMTALHGLQNLKEK